ncbi:DUF262 domain-containing HNH endonuclease family protein [uncultured Clostridium sp.]|uniref:DUF262 domain-containing protein n=1 Tax=uncultured Clostridium sp. TaxID=59620 RepID=UPI00262A9CC8|nr:DUF262 domain-containing HNH endonuclease family protein [uncultured Clostridium sp.]
MFTEKIKAKEYFIKDLLSPKFLFEIPDYQRAYSWTTENLKQLVDDINDSIRLNEGKDFENYEPYFIGSVVLCGKEYREDGFGRYEVIDGQQRLTSLIMLIATIRDIINNDEYRKVLTSLIYQEPNELMGIEENIRVKVRGKESDFFKKYVLTEMGTSLVTELDKAELSETKLNMVNALEIFRTSFIDEKGILLESKLNDFIKYLLQKVVLVVITTNSFESAFRLFNVINSRGLPLTNADLLKSENLRVIPLEERQKYTEIWENDEIDLGKDALEMLIGFMRTTTLKKKAEASLYDEYTKVIYPKKDGYKGVEFTNHMHAIKEIYSKYVVDAELGSDDKNKNIYYKNLLTAMREFLPYEDWAAAIIRFVEKFNPSADDILAFVKLLEKRIVIDWVNGNSFADRLTRVYDIINVIDSAASLDAIRQSDAFIADLEKTTGFFRNALNDMDFYSKGRMTVPKYVFVRMDMELNEGEIVDYYTNKVMVEHVLPRNAKDASWLVNFKADQRRNFANKLGNLVLIAGAKNTRLNNKPFTEKVEEYLSKKGKFKITEEIFANENWNMDILEKRQNALAAKALEMWTKF